MFKKWTERELPVEEQWEHLLIKSFKGNVPLENWFFISVATLDHNTLIDEPAFNVVEQLVRNTLLSRKRVMDLVQIAKACYSRWESCSYLVDEFIRKTGGGQYPIDIVSYHSNVFSLKNESYAVLMNLLHNKTSIPILILNKLATTRSYTFVQDSFSQQLTNNLESSSPSVNELVHSYFCNLAHVDELGPELLKNHILAYGSMSEYETNKALAQAWKEERMRILEYQLTSTPSEPFITAEYIDNLSPIEFEQLIAQVFIGMGYNALLTKTSGDQGLDVIAEKGMEKWGIQVKHYSHSVGNDAVQEVIAGRQFYGCAYALVATNNYFTQSAKALAAQTGVVLWDRNEVLERVSPISPPQ